MLLDTNKYTMNNSRYQVHYSHTKSEIKDIFAYLAYYPQCDFILHMVYDNDWSTIPELDLPLLLWNAGEAFIEDTTNLHRDFVYVTGNAQFEHTFNVHDIAASKIWSNKLNFDCSKNKNFLFLNGKDVGHRRYLYSHMCQNNLLKDTIYSYINKSNVDSWFDNKIGFDKNDVAFAKLFEHTIPVSPFDNTNLIRNLPQTVYANTYCSIIGETVFQHYPGQQVPLMLTEKTYSACANLHLFVIAGAYGSINLLHRQGFETFGDLWDESYDKELQPKKRLDKICDTINYIARQDIAKLYTHCKPRLLHNQNLIYNIDIKSRVNNVTQWLTN